MQTIRSFYLLTGATLLLSGSVLMTSCGTGKAGNAAELYRQKQYHQAIEKYKGLAKSAKGADKAKYNYQIGDAYRNIEDYTRATNYYKLALEGGYKTPAVYYGYAQALKMGQDYEAAIAQLETYQKENPSDTLVKNEIRVIRQYMADQKSSSCQLYEVNPFRDANSRDNDYSPMVLKKEGMVFSSDRPEATGKKIYGLSGKKYSDLFLLPRDQAKKGAQGKWKKAEIAPVSGVSTADNQGTVAFDSKGSLMYFSDCNGPLDGSSKKIRPNCVIKVARRQGKGWSDPTPLNFCTDTVLNYGHPALSPDGTKLIFAMDKPDGMGNHDLYLSTYVKRDKSWSEPVNLGATLNTKGREVFPYFFNDTTLYFSSDGHAGLGGLDLFVSHGRGVEWSRPEAVRYPLNSGGDDFSITFDESGKAGFFTSNRPGSRGDDIYEFKLRPQEYFVKGTVFLVKDKDTLVFKGGADVALQDLTHADAKNQTIKTKPDGKYRFKMTEGTDFNLVGTSAGYQPILERKTNGTTRNWLCSRDTIVNIYLTPPVEIVIPGILYDLNSAALRPESKKALDSVKNILTTYPYLVVELASHTDCRATMKYNDSLSDARAKSCVDYLVENGIDRERLAPKGYGERKLLNNCGCEPDNKTGPGATCSEEEHQLNRRTTISIIRTDYRPKRVEKPEGENGEGGEGEEGEGGEGGE